MSVQIVCKFGEIVCKYGKIVCKYQVLAIRSFCTPWLPYQEGNEGTKKRRNYLVPGPSSSNKHWRALHITDSETWNKEYIYTHILNLVTKINIIQYTQLSMLNFFLLTHFNLKIHGVGEKKESGKLKQIGKVVSSYCWSILNKAYTIGNIILFIIFRSSWSDKAWPNQKMGNCIPQYYLEAVACRWTQNGQGWSQPRPWSCPARLPRSSPAPINPAASRSSRSWIRGVF